jgi:hypothetical protein
LVTVEAGRIAGIEHQVLDAFRWARTSVDVSDADTDDAVLATIHAALAEELSRADGRPLAARVVLTGATRLHEALTRDLAGLRERVINEARAIDPARVWIEAVRLRTTPSVDVEALRERGDALGRLLRHIDELVASPPEGLLEGWPVELLSRLGNALPDDHPLRTPHDPTMLARARDLLLAALTSAA